MASDLVPLLIGEQVWIPELEARGADAAADLPGREVARGQAALRPCRPPRGGGRQHRQLRGGNVRRPGRGGERARTPRARTPRPSTWPVRTSPATVARPPGSSPPRVAAALHTGRRRWTTWSTPPWPWPTTAPGRPSLPWSRPYADLPAGRRRGPGPRHAAGRGPALRHGRRRLPRARPGRPAAEPDQVDRGAAGGPRLLPERRGGDFRPAVLGAVNYGRDADSIATMAGAICAALGGPTVVPDRVGPRDRAGQPDRPADRWRTSWPRRRPRSSPPTWRPLTAAAGCWTRCRVVDPRCRWAESGAADLVPAGGPAAARAGPGASRRQGRRPGGPAVALAGPAAVARAHRSAGPPTGRRPLVSVASPGGCWTSSTISPAAPDPDHPATLADGRGRLARGIGRPRAGLGPDRPGRPAARRLARAARPAACSASRWRRSRGTGIRAIAEETGNWPVRGLLHRGRPERGDGRRLALEPPLRARPACVENIDGMPEDDDLNYPLLNLGLLERARRPPSTEDVATAWLADLPAGRVFTAERAAYRNLLLAVPPERGRPGPQPVPGVDRRADPRRRLRLGPTPATRTRRPALAWPDAVLSHTRNGVYGELWVGRAGLGRAWSPTTSTRCSSGAAAVVPPRSELAEAIAFGTRFGRRAAGPGRRGSTPCTRATAHLHWVHVLNNAATIACALSRVGGRLHHRGRVRGDGRLGHRLRRGHRRLGARRRCSGAAQLPAAWTGAAGRPDRHQPARRRAYGSTTSLGRTARLALAGVAR